MNGTSSKPKILAIGLDSADPELILKWCDSGHLPTLAKLRDQGSWGRLDTFPGLADDAVWASFCTGTHPGFHGRYNFLQFDQDAYSEKRVRDDFLKVDPFWLTLSSAGKRVAVIDVPKCPLTPGLNGIQLSDWRVHGRDGPTRSYPRDLASRIQGRYGTDKSDVTVDGEYLCSPWALSENAQERLRTELAESVVNKAEALKQLLQEEPWDLFLCVFKEGHCASHQFWYSQAGTAPGSLLPDNGDLPREELKGIYQGLDEAVRQLLECVDEQTTVFVFSSLGMGNNYSGNHLLDSVLLRLERNRLLRIWQRIFSIYAKHRRFGRVLKPWNKFLRPLRSAIELPHNGISGAVRVNVQGREKHGRIARGDEFSRYCDQLATELSALRDPETGERIVREVIYTARELSGPFLDELPDLFVVWNREFPIGGACSPSIGTLQYHAPPRRSGNHIPGGLYFSTGPGRGMGRQQEGASILDLAPTFAALLGVNLPTALGKPLQPVLAQSARKT